MLAWVTWQQWTADYAPAPIRPPEMTEAPQAADPTDMELPQLDDTTVDAQDVMPDVMPSVDGEPAPTSSDAAPAVRVSTNVFEIEISTVGGTLQGATLLNYPVHKDQPDDLVQLLSTEPNQLGLIQTGLRSTGEGAEPNHRAIFTSTRQSFDIGGADEFVVPLSWTDGEGVTVEKRYRFTRGSYAVVIEQIVTNNSEQPWRGAEYALSLIHI